ncbi:hypothetical protein C0J52_12056 [Blattella germanica]|nr:hypothetical protein C0J52_12056 [Blattella germanica]
MFGFHTPKNKGALSRMLDHTPKSGILNTTPNRKLNGTPKQKINGTPQEKFKETSRGKLNGTPQERLAGTPQGRLAGTPQGRLTVTPQKKLKGTPQGKLNGKLSTPLSKRSHLIEKVSVTPRSASYKVATAKTPYSLRTRFKSKIASAARKIASGTLSDSESDFSASEDEYKPTDSENSSSSSNEETEEHSEEEKEEEEDVKEQKSKPKRQTRQHEMEYILETDGFFTSQKSITSNNTLNRLQQPRLAEEQLQKLLESMTQSHQQAVRGLYEENAQNFSKWMFVLREQYSIVLYGLGSKRHILQEFRTKMLKDHLVLEVNGFFPSLTIKEIVDSIADELLELSDRPAALLECLEEIEAELSSELFIIIHNIDGLMLRSDKSQDILSRLVKMENIHLIASIDHINAPLIWDHAKLSRYNFLWWDVTSFQPYNGETQFETSLLVQQSGKLALSSLSNVFHSLTTNARNIFIMMVKHQLDHQKDPTYQGMPFKDLYWSSRESLLVSSDVALRAQLTEFLDHRLVRQKRSADGFSLYLLELILQCQWKQEGGYAVIQVVPFKCIKSSTKFDFDIIVLKKLDNDSNDSI